jgi:type IV secretion system protein TrbL
VSILVVYLISGVVVSYIPQFQAAIDNGGVTNITPLLVMCAASILIFFLAWKAPTIASSIMSGTTSVNTSDMASFGMTMVAAGAASAAGGLAAVQGAATGGMAAARGAVKGYDFAKGLMGGGAGSISEAGGGGMTQDSLGGMPGGGTGSNGKPSAADSARQNLALLGGAPSGMVLDPGFDNSDFGSDSGAGDASSASIGGQGNSGSGSAPKDEDKKPSLVSRAKSIAQNTQQQANMVKDWIPDAQNGGTLHIDHKE